MDRTDLLQLSLAFAALAEEIANQGEAGPLLRRVADLAVEHVPGCRGAAISSFAGRQLRLLAASDPLTEHAERLQAQFGEGPSFDASHTARTLAIGGLEYQPGRWARAGSLSAAGEPGQWPRSAPAVDSGGHLGCVLAFRLVIAPATTLALYAGPSGFGDPGRQTATIFACQAGVVLALLSTREQAGSLETALQNSREIGTALGILMAQRKITHEAAFDLLRTASQQLHRKLRDLAADVVQTGTLPDPPPGRPAA